MQRGFDVARIESFSGGKMRAHAHSQVFARLLPEADIPVIPVFINAITPPLPAVQRVFNFGKGLAESIDEKLVGKRIVIGASGGLSHFTALLPYEQLTVERGFGEICTDFDRSILEWVQNGELSRVADIPDHDILNNGDVELRQGISFFGALPEGLRPERLVYEPFYRGPHGLLGRILGDRTMTIDLLDFGRRLDDGVLDPRIFLDEEIYQLELERIWRRSWVFLGHETMLAGPGDFITTHLGEDPILLVSDPQGKPRAFLNRCRHKGVKLCPWDRGSAKNFSCVYHNWTYANDGSLVDVPEEDAGYRHLDKSQWGLVEVPKVASYGGFIFGNWDAGAMSLDDYLGDFRYYIDNACGRLNAPGGVEMSPIRQRIRTSHNWKIAAENSSDMYHVAASHVGAMETVEGIMPHFNMQAAETNYLAVINEGKPELPTHTVLSARLITDRRGLRRRDRRALRPGRRRLRP